MKKINLLIVLAVSVLSITGCKKDKDLKSDAEIIVDKKWVITAFTVDGKDAFQDAYAVCERDNIQTFSSDGKYKVDEGATKCDANDPQINETGNWSITDDKLTISQEGNSLQVQATITELNDKTLKLSYKGIDFNNPNSVTIVTCTAQ